MSRLEHFKISDYKELSYLGKVYANKIFLKNVYDNNDKELITIPKLIDKAILLKAGGWYHMLYNSLENLAEVIKEIPTNTNQEVKFAALPKELFELVKEKWPELHFHIHNVYCYSDQEQIILPFKYEVSPLNLTDVDFLSVNQPYLDEYGGTSYLQHCIETELTACVRVNGQLVGWELFHEDGTMGSLRVIREYRKNGIGEAIQAYLINKVLEVGLSPFCYVSIYNTSSNRLMQKLGMQVIDNVCWARKRTQEEIEDLKTGVF